MQSVVSMCIILTGGLCKDKRGYTRSGTCTNTRTIIVSYGHVHQCSDMEYLSGYTMFLAKVTAKSLCAQCVYRGLVTKDITMVLSRCQGNQKRITVTYIESQWDRLAWAKRSERDYYLGSRWARSSPKPKETIKLASVQTFLFYQISSWVRTIEFLFNKGVEERERGRRRKEDENRRSIRKNGMDGWMDG